MPLCASPVYVRIPVVSRNADTFFRVSCASRVLSVSDKSDIYAAQFIFLLLINFCASLLHSDSGIIFNMKIFNVLIFVPTTVITDDANRPDIA